LCRSTQQTTELYTTISYNFRQAFDAVGLWQWWLRQVWLHYAKTL